MSIYTREALYDLLPAVYRQRDAELGYPLRDLVGILAREAEIVERDVDRLYADWFIETCREWVVPYLGDLVGVDGIAGSPPPGFSRRAEVANTLSYRRRKGTVGVLEQLARDVTGWPARAVEFFERLAATQHLNHPRPGRGGTPDLRRAFELELVGGPFDTTARTAELRRIEPRRGHFNIPNIGLFLWRLRAYPLRLTQATAAGGGPGRFAFNTLGVDSPLFTLPATETEAGGLAGEANVPTPIRRRALHRTASAYWGESFGIYEPDGAGGWRLIPAAEVEACDLTDWERPVAAGKVAVDPVLGRLAFGADVGRPEFRVGWHQGFSGDLGGGQYERQATLSLIAGERLIVVGDGGHDTIGAALEEWRGDAGPVEGDSAVLEIRDSRTYTESLPAIELPQRTRLEIRAANEQRPTLRLGAELRVVGGAASGFALNGLLIADRPVRVEGQLDRLAIEHCTLVPGLSLAADGSPESPAMPSLVITSGAAEAIVRSSILGGLRADPGATVTLEDCILDAAGGRAYLADGGGPGGSLTVRRSTVVGGVFARELPLAESSIFLRRVTIEQRQSGCVRFCFVPLGSRVPRRFRCQPVIPDAAGEDTAERLEARVTPCFTSLRYGDPGYCQLDWRTPREILRGGEDGSEMGAFQHLYQAHREDALRARLDEYLRLGLEAGILFVT